ncbi:MAG: DUF4097 family beta strand repeat-containing protein [Actinomycetes bacterium]
MTTFSTNMLRAESFDISDPEIKIECRWSDVVVVESPDSMVHIEIVGEGSNSAEFADMVNISRSENRLKIQMDKRNGLKDFLNRGASQLTLFIKVPSSAELKIESVLGDVLVEQTVASAQFTTVSGDIKFVKSPTGKLSVTSVSGDVVAHISCASELSFKTVSGDVRVFVIPGFEVEVDGNTVSGNLNSEIALNSSDGQADGTAELVKLKVNTVSGDFTLARS